MHSPFAVDISNIQRPLRLFAGAFAVGICGVAIGFIADYFGLKVVGGIAFVVVFVTILTGFASIAWGWYRIFTRNKEGAQSGR